MNINCTEFEDHASEDQELSEVEPLLRTTENSTNESRAAIRGLLLISVAFSLQFTAYNGLGDLQSSLNRAEGMGVVTQAILYATAAVFCFFLPSLVLASLGHRKTIALCFGGYMSWMAANGYAVWSTLIPASIVVGVSGGPLWMAQASYIRIMASRYVKATDQVTNENAMTIRFFGVFGAILGLSGLASSLTNYFVLTHKRENGTTSDVHNGLEQCGANDCPWYNKNNTNLDKPPSSLVWTLVSIYLGLSVIAFLLIILLLEDTEDTRMMDNETLTKESTKAILLKSTRLLIKPYMLLWIPMAVFKGLRISIISADWNNSFVGCALGIDMIGLVSLPNAVVAPLVELGTGWFAKYTGRIAIILTANTMVLGSMVFLLLWQPYPDKVWLFITVGILQIVSSCLIEPTMKGVLVACFPEDPDPAFVTSMLFTNVANSLGLALTAFLCTKTKLISGFVLIVIATVCYIAIELLLKTKCRVSNEVEKQGDKSVENVEDFKAT